MTIELDDIIFAYSDAQRVESEIITTYEQINGTSLYPGDPVRLFLESLAAVIVQQRVIIDYTGKQNLLLYAAEEFLDHLGALTETERLSAAAASTTMRFSISAAIGYAVPIPSGTRTTPDGKLIFATAQYAEIAPGGTYVDVISVCQSSGSSGNGFVPGQINRMIDALPYVSTVANTTTSEGGADIEDDESFRSRIQIAPERFSVAGPILAYRYWAMTAHQSISDVAVYSPAATEVKILPLLTGGILPGPEILSLVDAAVNDRSVRPLTDLVTVEAPEAVTYAVDMIYYISRTNVALAGQIQTAVNAAVADYVLWQKSAIGRDINPDELIYRVRSAGAKRVVLASPAFTILSDWQVAQDSSTSINYGGLEDE